MSQVVVLDSHVWFWWVNLENGRLSPRLIAAIENTERVGVSAVSCYELALAHHHGRLDDLVASFGPTAIRAKIHPGYLTAEGVAIGVTGNGHGS